MTYEENMTMHKTRYFAMCAALLAAVVATAAGPARAAEDKQSKLIEVLKSDAPGAQKAITCKQLAVYGGKEAVPALAPLLADEKLSSWALIALEAIPDPAADEALRDALGKLQGRQLIGVINSIGVRRDAQAVDGLLKRMKEADAEAASCAAAALGRIGGAQVAAILEPALASAPPAVRSAVAEGCILCAEKLLAEGKDAEAVKLYDAVRKADVPKQRILEATRGAILARKSGGIPLLIEQLNSADKGLYYIGLNTARELPGADVTKALVAEVSKAKPEKQAQLILVLADRGDAATLPVMLQAAKSGSDNVRLAAIGVLQRMGNVSCVPVLLESAMESNAAVSEKSLDVLAELRGKDIDADLAARLAKAEGKTRAILIRLAGQRQIAASVPMLLKAADDADGQIRAAAITALGETVDLGTVPVLIARVVKPQQAEDAKAAEAALSAACVRMADRDACADKLVAAMPQAPLAVKCKLVEVLGAMGGAKALLSVKAATKSAEDEVQDTAFRVLGEWMSTDAAPVLLDLSKTAENNKYKIRALRGCIRIVGQFAMPLDQRLAMCKEILAAAQRDDERKLVLGILGRNPSAESLALVAPHLGGTLKDDAAKAAVAIAEKIVSAQPGPVADAMQKVVAGSENAAVVKKAKGLLDQAKKGK
jgi:HEAT repeat protein